ncbi:MAG: alpha/beta hydrolase [Gemmatimonadota bacterium]|nr:alpha/beta hydrolase [Gemmatimonadota bacterium]
MIFDLPLHVEILGPDPDTGVDSIVLLHGYGGSSFSWRYWAPFLAKRAHVVLVDMKGFGSAPKPDDGQYGPRHQAELIYRLILQADLQRVTLIGHSLGGGVALGAALRLLDSEPGRLKRLILVASAAYKQRMPLFVALAKYRRLASTALRILGTQFVIRHVLKSIVFDPSEVSDDQVLGYAKPLSSPEAHRALIDTALAIVPPDLEKLTARFEELDVPTLVLWGRQDRVVPLWVGERLADKLPDAKLQVLENCGHMPAEELPKESWEALQTFLDQRS